MVTLVVTMDLIWIMVNIFLGSSGSGFPHIQPPFTGECGIVSCFTIEATLVGTLGLQAEA